MSQNKGEKLQNTDKGNQSWIGGLEGGMGTQLDSLGLTWILTQTWSHLDSFRLTSSNFDTFRLIWFHVASLDLTWTLLVSREPTWSHLVSLGLTMSSMA